MNAELFDRNGKPTPGALGRELKREGQDRAARNAGDEWCDRIIELLRDWCAIRRGRKVTIEEFRQHVPAADWPDSSKAWGALPRMAVAAGLLQPTGEYVKARSPRTHAHPVSLWRVV